MIKSIIVDDEPSAIKSMKWELENFCPEIEVIETFTNPEEAVSAINYLKPDCVFLDIEMPQMDGFTLLEHLTHRDFALVVTTAYESYALKAFKENAIDYLLKPVDSDDLTKCVKKIQRMVSNGSQKTDIQEVISLLSSSQSRTKIPLHLNGRIVYQDITDITYCQADGNYTTIYKADGSKVVVSKKIKEIEAMLNHSHFHRVHQSYLVNTSCIKEYIRSDGQYLMIQNDISIPVSRAKRAEVLELLEKI